jgi:futalosine hydrolase
MQDRQRRLDRYPEVVAEDMEGYAVALACRLENVPLVIVRGISNVVGDRLSENWQIPEALTAAWSIAEEAIGCSSWDNPA